MLEVQTIQHSNYQTTHKSLYSAAAFKNSKITSGLTVLKRSCREGTKLDFPRHPISKVPWASQSTELVGWRVLSQGMWIDSLYSESISTCMPLRISPRGGDVITPRREHTVTAGTAG